MRLLPLLVSGALILGAPLARMAHADDEPAQPAGDAAQEARQQYQAGMQSYQAKRFVEAALHFEAAVIQRPHAVALYTAALAWEQASRPERAADDFVRALDVPGLSAPQAQNARDRVATLERTMGTLEVAAPEGWRVQLDANTGVLVPAHLHAMPGMHTLTVQPSDAPIQHRDVTLELGKTLRLAIAAEPSAAPPLAAKPPSVAPEPAPAPEPPSPAPAFDVKRPLGFAAVGAGAASLLAGVVLGVSALSARDAYNAGPTQAAYDHASGLQTWTDVAFVAGGVFVAAGVALVLWPSTSAAKHDGERAVSLAPTPGGAVVRGAF